MKRNFDVVLFDFGGVFTASPFAAVVRYSQQLGLAPERLTELVFGSYQIDSDHPWHQLERGDAQVRQFTQSGNDRLERATGCKGADVEFVNH